MEERHGQRLEGGCGHEHGTHFGRPVQMAGGLGWAETQRGEFRLGVDSFGCMLRDLPHPEGTREPLKVSE